MSAMKAIFGEERSGDILVRNVANGFLITIGARLYVALTYAGIADIIRTHFEDV